MKARPLHQRIERRLRRAWLVGRKRYVQTWRALGGRVRPRLHVFVVDPDAHSWTGRSMSVFTTDVGGNRQVVPDPRLGTVVPLERCDLLETAIHDALSVDCDRDFIRTLAANNDWKCRIKELIAAISAAANTSERPGSVKKLGHKEAT